MLWLGGGGCEPPLLLLRGIDPHTGSRVPHQLEPFRAGAPDQRPSFLTGDVPPFVALVLVAYRALGSVPPSPDFRSDQLVSEVIEDGRAGQRPDLHRLLLHRRAVPEKGEDCKQVVADRFEQKQDASRAKKPN